ncbi:MAG: MerR family transcriptional regulator, partial [Oscillospiraceae bacterium]
MRKIGEVSKLAGVSIRTLRYYDEIGLLCPKTLESGYRVYDDADLERLWQILFCRDLLKLIPKTKLVFICMDSPCESSTKQAMDIAKLLKAQSIHTVGVLFENSNISDVTADIFDAVVYSDLVD